MLRCWKLDERRRRLECMRGERVSVVFVCCCCCCFGGEGCQRTPPFSCFNVTCGCRRMREWHLRSVFRAEREGRRLVLREDTCVCLPHDNVGLQSCSGLCACAWRKESGRLGMDDRFTWREREREMWQHGVCAWTRTRQTGRCGSAPFSIHVGGVCVRCYRATRPAVWTDAASHERRMCMYTALE